ncbi:MAG: MFS transporter, partial [Acidobacteriota bacterium]|nr:MFS transporter [Acidobacteriota bacterium]
MELAALILASALITLDGTAATVALPAIAQGLEVPFSRLQWISNAPLLALAALLLPAGGLADSHGRGRLVRIGLLTFTAASATCALAPSYPVL